MNQGYRYLLLLLMSLALLGCAESNREKATGKANIRAINAVVGAPSVNFLIEERNLDAVPFKNALAQRFDDLSYDFRFELRLPGGTAPKVLARQFADVAANHDYVFVLDGTVANPQIRLWDTEERQWDGSETVFEIVLAHLNDTLGPVDVYFAAPGTQPVAGNEVATLDNGERAAPMEFSGGDYELMLTPAGDPQTVLYTSGSRSWQSAATSDVIIFDKDPTVTGDVNLRQVTAGGNSVELSDPRFPPQAQFINAAFGSGNIDIAEDGEFNPPLVTDLAFGERTADIDVSPAAADYTYTAAGNMGAILLEDTQTNLSGLHVNRLLVGPPGDLAVISTTSARRPFSTNPRFALTHAAANFDNVDVYLLPAGNSVADSNPTSPNVPFGFASGMGSVAADSYELSVTLPGEKTVVAGPLALELAAGDVVETVILDSADPNAAQILTYSNAP